MNQLVFIRQLFYQLKMQYGQPLSVYRLTVGNTNLQTGEKSLTKAVYPINRAVVMPSVLLAKALYDLSYIAANKNFTYGATFEQDDKGILIDQQDIAITIKPEDFLIFDHKRYEIKKIENMEQNAGYIILARHVVGSPPGEVHLLSVYQGIRFTGSPSSVLN